MFFNGNGRATKNFYWSELECKCGCGMNNISIVAISKLQKMRDIVKGPLKILSAARCPRHNVAVGGAPLSHHRSTLFRPSDAFDIALAGYEKEFLIKAAVSAGFKGIGISYNTFLHVDNRRNLARW